MFSGLSCVSKSERIGSPSSSTSMFCCFISKCVWFCRCCSLISSNVLKNIVSCSSLFSTSYRVFGFLISRVNVACSLFSFTMEYSVVVCGSGFAGTVPDVLAPWVSM